MQTPQWLADFYEWLHHILVTIVDFLNPVTRLQMLFVWASSFLPDRNDQVNQLIEQTRMVVVSFAEFIAYLDYFINIPFLAACLVVMALTEAILLALRGWRVIRSLAT